MVQTGYGEASGLQPRALDVAVPLGMAVARRADHFPVAAWFATYARSGDAGCAAVGMAGVPDRRRYKVERGRVMDKTA